MNKTIKKKAALFESKYGISLYDESMEKYVDSVRITEYVEIDFPKLPIETVVVAQVAAIDRKIEAIKNNALNAVSSLQTKKAELLALTHESDE